MLLPRRARLLLVCLLVGLPGLPARGAGDCTCDFSGDMIVGIPDFEIWKEHAGETCDDAIGICADCTQDGVVGIPDFALMLGQIGNSCPKGDLNVPDGRLLRYDGTRNWYPPPVPADTTGWTMVNVSDYMAGCSLADDATDDRPCVDLAHAAAVANPGPTVLYFPPGVYNFIDEYSVHTRRSDFVIRCEDTTSVRLEFTNKAAHKCLEDINGATTSNIGFCGGDQYLDQVWWMDGFFQGDRVLTLFDATNYQPGDWVRARMDTFGSSFCLDGNIYEDKSFDHYAKVVAKNGNQITIDRPLRMNYNLPDCGYRSVTRIGFVENVGVENCHIVYPDTPVTGYLPFIAFEHAANGWVTGSHLENGWNTFVRARTAARILVESSHFENLFAEGPNGTQGVESQASSDFYVINNVFENVRVASECQGGAEGHVFAYNYEVPGFVDRERSFFAHGKYCREALVEKNDLNSAPQPDNYWGRQGPRLTWFSNRMRSTEPAVHDKAVYMSTHRDNSGTIGDRMTWIANAGNWFMSGPSFPVPEDPQDAAKDFDRSTTNLWLEKNLASVALGLKTPESTTSCGTPQGPGDCVELPAGFHGENYEGTRRPASWDGFDVPPSLFYTEVPAWWCKEACDFDESGIGALGDDLAGELCKLPAQIRYEGGTCTTAPGP